MGDREFEDITPESLINRPHTQEPFGTQPLRQGTEMPNATVIKDRFLKAIKEIAHLEKILEDKNTALASAAEEKDRLIHALNKSFEDKKRLQDRIADIDIVRNMEIVEFKTGLDKLRDDRDFLIRQKDEIVEDIYKKDRTIEDLKNTIGRKELQLNEAQTYLDTALDTLRKNELKYKELEANYKLKEQSEMGFAETSPLVLNSMPQNTETEAEYLSKIEDLNNTLSVLRTEIDEKDGETISLRNEISAIQADRDREKEVRADETANTEDISLKLALAAGIDSARNETGKATKNLSADKKLLYVKSPIETESAPQFPEKMIYAAPPEDIKKKMLKIAIPIILGIAGILLAYNFY